MLHLISCSVDGAGDASSSSGCQESAGAICGGNQLMTPSSFLCDGPSAVEQVHASSTHISIEPTRCSQEASSGRQHGMKYSDLTAANVDLECPGMSNCPAIFLKFIFDLHCMFYIYMSLHMFRE